MAALLGARTAVNDEEASVVGGARDVRVEGARAGAGDGETAPLPGARASSTTTSLKHVPRSGHWPPKTYTLRPTAVAEAPIGGEARAASRGGGLAHAAAGAVGGEAEDPEVVERAGASRRRRRR